MMYLLVNQSVQCQNQRKWYAELNKCYIKEQFYYQGIYWDDYKVEQLSSKLSECLNTLGIVIVKQHIVSLGTTYGVVSDDFARDGEYFVSIQRLFQSAGLEYPEQSFPLTKFNKIVNLVEDCCKLDITDYLIVMCVMDYILLNEDRHLNNFGVLRDSDGYHRVAPLFDFGLGLFQHDRKYIGKDLSDAYLLVEGKPFNPDMSAIVKALARSGYKDKICTILNGITSFDVSIIEDAKAQEHVNVALQTLVDLCM